MLKWLICVTEVRAIQVATERTTYELLVDDMDEEIVLLVLLELEDKELDLIGRC